MPAYSTVELTDLRLETDIGTYRTDDVVPRAHLLDLTLEIDPALVLIPADGMAYVFDYDPLIADIDRLARDGHYETQERLMTRIAEACCAYPPIRAIDIALRKTPVLNESGALGVRLTLDEDAFGELRGARTAA